MSASTPKPPARSSQASPLSGSPKGSQASVQASASKGSQAGALKCSKAGSSKSILKTPANGSGLEAKTPTPASSRLKSWLPLGLILAAALTMVLIGFSRRSPWPEVSILLDRLCGPGRWSAGELSYDPDTKILTVADLAIPSGGLMNLPGPLSVRLLSILMEGGDPEAGLIQRLQAIDLTTEISLASLNSAAASSGASSAGASPAETLKASIANLTLNDLRLPPDPADYDPSEPPPLFLAAQRAELRGVAIGDDVFEAQAASIIAPEGLRISFRGALSAPSAEVSGLTVARQGPSGGNRVSLGALRFRGRSQDSPSRLFLANLIITGRSQGAELANQALIELAIADQAFFDQNLFAPDLFDPDLFSPDFPDSVLSGSSPPDLAQPDFSSSQNGASGLKNSSENDPGQVFAQTHSSEPSASDQKSEGPGPLRRDLPGSKSDSIHSRRSPAADSNNLSDIPSQLILESLEITDPAFISGSAPKESMESIILGAKLLSSLTPGSWPLSLIIARPFSAVSMEAKHLSIIPRPDLILSAETLSWTSLTPELMAIAAQGLALTWPDASNDSSAAESRAAANHADDRPGGFESRAGGSQPPGPSPTGNEGDESQIGDDVTVEYLLIEKLAPDSRGIEDRAANGQSANAQAASLETGQGIGGQSASRQAISLETAQEIGGQSASGEKINGQTGQSQATGGDSQEGRLMIPFPASSQRSSEEALRSLRAGPPPFPETAGSGAARRDLSASIFSEAGLNPLTAELTLLSAFDSEAGRWSLTIADLELAGGLASAAMVAEISNLTEAAMESLSRLTPSQAALAAVDPAFHNTGLTRLAVDISDNGLGQRLAEAESARLGISEQTAPSRLADALEMWLTIRLDPALANLHDLAGAVKRYLKDPSYLTIRANPDPPLSPAKIAAIAPLRGNGLIKTGPSLNLSISVNYGPPIGLIFRPEGAFDVDYTGDDSSLHPRPGN